VYEDLCLKKSKKEKKKSAYIQITVIKVLISTSHKSIVIHGLGAMVLRATSMALTAQDALENQITLKPTTETISLIDDIIPEDMDKDLEIQKRQNSIIHIKLEAKEGLAELQRKTGQIIHHPSRNRRSRRWQ
jgi:hypothetical protein